MRTTSGRQEVIRQWIRIACLAWVAVWAAQHSASAATSYLDNGQIRVGVSDVFGGAIEYLAESANPGRNYINRHDPGRLAQLSYYGSPRYPGADPGFDPWLWNPIQGGDVMDNTPGVQALTNDGTTIYTRSQPLDWAQNNVRRNAIFETWITLEDRAVRLQMRVTNDGEDHSFYREQEVPAIYVTTDLTHLKTYAGSSPFTGGAISTMSVPQLPAFDFYRPTEYWAAWVNNDDFGVGTFVQDVQHHITFRAGAQGVANDYASDTNYLSPVPKFTVGPNMVDASVSYLMLDTISGIRSFAESKAVYPSVAKWEFDEDNNRERWGICSGNDVEVANGNWAFTSSADPYVLSPQFQVPADSYKKVQVRMSVSNNAPDTFGQLFWNRLSDDPFDFNESRSRNFTVIPDGRMHTYTFGLSGQTNWDGTITQLRLDPTLAGDNTDYTIDYIRIVDPSLDPSPERIVVNMRNPFGGTLGNGGANNGFVSTLGDDGLNTLTITAVDSSNTIGDSSQDGLVVQKHGTDEWLNDAEWFDLVFTLAGPDAGDSAITLVAGDLGWFNDGCIGENVDLYLDPTSANTLLGSIGYGDLVSDGYFNTSINIPLGQTIRFDIRNEHTGWPNDNWLIRQMEFETATIPGDANRDGRVDSADAAVLAANWQTVGGMGWADGDFNGDNNVDDIDATLLAANWGYGASDALVPEPSALAVLCGLLLCGLIAGCRRTSGFPA